ncbi:hypothetical protein [Actinocorallia longicatena]|uniref:Uncharacterized protein n=1 Tax=Actinocorallia longicatena TaxID=111803 RepID=A0ABP6QAM8_9ACTN
MRIVLPLALTAALLAVPVPAQAAAPLAARAAKAYGKPVIAPGKTTKVKVKAHVTGRNVTEVDVQVEHVDGKGIGFVRDIKRISGTSGDGVYEGYVELDKADWGGRYNINIGATNGTSKDADYDFRTFTKVAVFTVHRQTKLTTSAPKKIKKGRKLLVLGQLTGFGRNGFAPMRRQKIAIYFRPKGSKKYTKVATVTTNSKGRYSRRFTAARDGSVAAVYAGTQVWQKRVTAWKKIDVV